MLAQLAFDAASNSSQSNCKRLCSYMLSFLSLQCWSILIILQLQVRNTEILWSIADPTWAPSTATKAGEGETAQHHQKHYHHQMLCIISISFGQQEYLHCQPQQLRRQRPHHQYRHQLHQRTRESKIVVRLVSSAWNLLQGSMRFHACVCSSTRKGVSAQWELSASLSELHWNSWTKEQASSRAISIIVIIIIIIIINYDNYEHHDHQDRRTQEQTAAGSISIRIIRAEESRSKQHGTHHHQHPHAVSHHQHRRHHWHHQHHPHPQQNPDKRPPCLDSSSSSSSLPSLFLKDQALVRPTPLLLIKEGITQLAQASFRD